MKNLTQEGFNLSQENFNKMLSNPFYCLNKVSETFVQEHEPLISEEEWIKAGANMIKEIGAEEYLKNLLENLKGNYV